MTLREGADRAVRLVVDANRDELCEAGAGVVEHPQRSVRGVGEVDGALDDPLEHRRQIQVRPDRQHRVEQLPQAPRPRYVCHAPQRRSSRCSPAASGYRYPRLVRVGLGKVDAAPADTNRRHADHVGTRAGGPRLDGGLVLLLVQPAGGALDHHAPTRVADGLDLVDLDHCDTVANGAELGAGSGAKHDGVIAVDHVVHRDDQRAHPRSVGGEPADRLRLGELPTIGDREHAESLDLRVGVHHEPFGRWMRRPDTSNGSILIQCVFSPWAQKRSGSLLAAARSAAAASLGGRALHHHAPPELAGFVNAVHLKAHGWAAHEAPQLAPGVSAKDHRVAVEDEVHRVDLGQAVDKDREASDLLVDELSPTLPRAQHLEPRTSFDHSHDAHLSLAEPAPRMP